MPINHHAYDPAARVYTVQFKPGGAIYNYQNVDSETASDVQGVEDADLGKTIQAVLVRGNFEFIKVEPDQDGQVPA